MHLSRAPDAGRVRAKPVEGRFLVLVLAVLKRFGERAGNRDLGWESVALAAPQVGRDPRVVGRGMGECLRRQAPTRFEVKGRFVQRAEDLRVALRPDDDHDRLVVFRRRADHRGAADIDLLDRFFECGVGLMHRVDERVQVAAHEVDLAQTVLGERGEMLGLVAPGQDACVDPRVKRLDPAVHHLGETGQLAHGTGIERRVLNHLERAPGREQLVAEPLESARECGETRLVANGQKSGWQAVPP